MWAPAVARLSERRWPPSNTPRVRRSSSWSQSVAKAISSRSTPAWTRRSGSWAGGHRARSRMRCGMPGAGRAVCRLAARRLRRVHRGRRAHGHPRRQARGHVELEPDPLDEEEPAVRRPREPEHPPCMTLEGPDRLAAAAVPQPGRTVVARGRQVIAPGQENHGADGSIVGQGQQHFGSLDADIPHTRASHPARPAQKSAYSGSDVCLCPRPGSTEPGPTVR